MKRRKKSTLLISISRDSLRNIFLFLNVKEINRICTVCILFKELSNDVIIWQEIFQRNKRDLKTELTYQDDNNNNAKKMWNDSKSTNRLNFYKSYFFQSIDKLKKIAISYGAFGFCVYVERGYLSYGFPYQERCNEYGIIYNTENEIKSKCGNIVVDVIKMYEDWKKFYFIHQIQNILDEYLENELKGYKCTYNVPLSKSGYYLKFGLFWGNALTEKQFKSLCKRGHYYQTK